MTLYVRDGPGGSVIRWRVDQDQLGEEAIAAVVGAAEQFPVEVDQETAAQIREEYARLLEQQTDGGTA